MSAATWLIGDVFDRLADLPDQSVHSVITSPPYWRKRKYLPEGHPMADREIGQESSPGEFLATLLRLTDELWRIVRDDGTIWINLGDSASQSGGAGGDYNAGGWRDGQPKYGRPRKGEASNWTTTAAAWLAGVIDSDGSISTHVNKRGDKTPTFVPWVRIGQMRPEAVKRAAEITGVGRVTHDKRGVWNWIASAQQCRYVLAHIWPYLVIKQRQALAAIDLSEHIEECGGRGASPTADDLAYRQMVRESIQAWNRGEPADWEPLRRPVITLPQWSADLPRPKSVCWIPEMFGASLAYGRNLLTGDPCQQWITRPKVTWCKPSPTPGEIIDKFREADELIVWASKAERYYFDLDSVREPPKPGSDDRFYVTSGAFRGHPRERTGQARPDRASNPKGVPPLTWWVVNSSSFDGAHYATFPPDLIRRPVIASCPPGGTILDPFGGSGTTAAVATGHGRNCVSIDFDEANAALARERVGMFLEVDDGRAPTEAAC